MKFEEMITKAGPIYHAGIYSLAGHLLKILDHEELYSGQITWEASHLPSGIYLFKLVDKHGVWTKKFMIQSY